MADILGTGAIKRNTSRDKFDRNYILLVQKRDGTYLRITRPFTLEMEIHRRFQDSTNAGRIRVYNLNQTNRDQIRKNQYDTSDLREIALYAGYGDVLPLVFSGNIAEAYSVREGTNFISTIESYPGGYGVVNTSTSTPSQEGVAQQSIVEQIARSLTKTHEGQPTGLSLGAIGNYAGNISRGNTYDGSSASLLSQITGGGFFIDNGKINCLNDNEAIDGPTLVISPSSGLLNTPLRQTTWVQIEMLFEAQAALGYLAQLQSFSNESQLNGLYTIKSIIHRGTISDAVCGTLTTSLELAPGDFTRVPLIPEVQS